MKLILKCDNEQSIAKIIASAKKLNVAVEEKTNKIDNASKDLIRERILKFKATAPSSSGDAGNWQKEQREDRNLPCNSCKFDVRK